MVVGRNFGSYGFRSSSGYGGLNVDYKVSTTEASTGKRAEASVKVKVDGGLLVYMMSERISVKYAMSIASYEVPQTFLY